MTSDAGLGEIGRSNYAAASEAIIGLTRTVARDLGRYGVTCNAIAPMVRTRLSPETAVSAGDPAGTGTPPDPGDWEGPGDPDDPENVAPLAVFLCTDAVPNVNGYVFAVRRGSIFLYSNPSIELSLHKWGAHTLDELDALVPESIGHI
jgi:NAD(P)-dependent dehydrogenase (short-subunit alcohol dehydrogenase family)